MRRFPPPPGGAAPATKLTPSRRSTEAPMQFEWERPRDAAASPFAGGSTALGEPARKRTHYEAMDVDTPPRVSFPASATRTADPFGFADSSGTTLNVQSAPPSGLGQLHFDASEFDAREALGVQSGSDGRSKPDQRKRDGDDKENENQALTLLDTNGPRRRRPATTNRKDKSPDRRQASRPEPQAEAHDEEDDEGMQINGRKLKGSDFSFQVHHHHAPDLRPPSAPEQFLNSNKPYVLLGYLQFGSLAVLAILVLSVSALFLYTLYADIQARLAALTVELRAEILQCAKAYVDNRCEPATRIPAMEKRCSGWEECMGREVIVVGKTRVVAETLAEVVNGFVDVISFKTMLFVLLSLGLCIYGSSVALAMLSSRSNSSTAPSHPQFAHLGAPPYGLGPYGYAHLPPAPFNQPWFGPNAGQKNEPQGLGLGAPAESSS